MSENKTKTRSQSMSELLRATTLTRSQVGLLERDVQRVEQLAQQLANDGPTVLLVLKELTAVIHNRCSE